MLQNQERPAPSHTSYQHMHTSRDCFINWTLSLQAIHRYSCAHHKLKFTYSGLRTQFFSFNPNLSGSGRKLQRELWELGVTGTQEVTGEQSSALACLTLTEEKLRCRTFLSGSQVKLEYFLSSWVHIYMQFGVLKAKHHLVIWLLR